MKRVLTAVILIPLVVVALFRAPLWLFALLVLGVALLAAKEYLDITNASGFRPFRGLSYAFLLLLFFDAATLVANSDLVTRAAYNFLGTAALLALVPLLLSPFLLLVFSMQSESLSKSLGDAAVSFLVLPYVGVTLTLLVYLRGPEYGSLYLLFTMLLVWGGDIAALYVGRAIGKHKLAPRISPGKTWEGAIASVVAAMAIAILLLHYINPIADLLTRSRLLPQAGFNSPPWPLPPTPVTVPMFEVAPAWLALLFGLGINVAAQLGDLVESALKRGAGLKDSGTLLPGHGGVLDRIDALLFALPVAVLFHFCSLRLYFERLGIG